MQFPNRLSRKFTFSAFEFETYIMNDRKMLLRFSEETNTSLETAYMSFRKNLIENFNKYSKQEIYKLKLESFSSDIIATDNTFNRLDVALYYSDNQDILNLISKMLQKTEKIFTSPVIINSIEDIETLREKKLQFLSQLRTEVD